MQEALTYELPYGRIQGFKGIGKASLLGKLATRLAYTREIFLVIPEAHQEPSAEGFSPGINFFVYTAERSKVVRVITNQYFLEKSYYVSKLSRNKDEVDANVKTLLNYMALQSERIPATETMAVGRRLEDWFAIREEPSLYTTHYMHPYKGKFHPKMARALINYTFPGDEGRVLDNFSGSGTSLVEAQWLGLESVGVDINPLSSLMSQVKVQCQEIGEKKLKAAIDDFLLQLEADSMKSLAIMGGQGTLSSPPNYDSSRFKDAIAKLPARVKRNVPEDQLTKILYANELLESTYGKVNGDPVHEFLLLGLSGAISDVSRRTKQDFNQVLRGRLYHLWGRVYLAHKLRNQLHVSIAFGECFVGDNRNLSDLHTIGGKRKKIQDNSIDCIVNSPPYSTALDYIRNDLPQLSILNFVDDMSSLEKNLMGNPNLKVYGEELQLAITQEQETFSGLPEVGKEMLRRMVDAGRGQEAGRVLKFWLDMRETLREMHRVLKPRAKAAVVIGDNNIQLVSGSKIFEQVPNVKVLEDLGQKVGLSVTEVIQRQIEKSMSGMIRNESIIIFAKS